MGSARKGRGTIQRLEALERLLPGLALLYDDPAALRESVAARLQDIVRDAPDDAGPQLGPRIERILRLVDELQVQRPARTDSAPDTTA